MSSSSYRDSYFQYRHLPAPHHILYAEWNQDILALPDEVANITMAMKDNTRTDAEEGRAPKMGKGILMYARALKVRH